MCTSRIGEYRIMIAERGLCNEICYNEITVFCNVDNGYVKVNRHNQVIGFELYRPNASGGQDKPFTVIGLTKQTLTLSWWL